MQSYLILELNYISKTYWRLILQLLEEMCLMFSNIGFKIMKSTVVILKEILDKCTRNIGSKVILENSFSVIAFYCVLDSSKNKLWHYCIKNKSRKIKTYYKIIKVLILF
jgi:hypothetical protein